MDESQLEHLERNARKCLRTLDNTNDILPYLEISKDDINFVQVFMEPGIDSFGLITLKTSTEKWFKLKFAPSLYVKTYDTWSKYCNSLSKNELYMLENLNKATLTRKDGHVLEQVDLGGTDVLYKDYDAHRGIVPNSLIGHLWHKIIQMEEKVNEMYDAPGMPGYEKARARFNENASKSL